jgi:hypothetical protein
VQQFKLKHSKKPNLINTTNSKKPNIHSPLPEHYKPPTNPPPCIISRLPSLIPSMHYLNNKLPLSLGIGFEYGEQLAGY